MSAYVPSAGLIGLVAKLFPLRRRPEFDHLPIEELRKKHRPWDHVGTVAFFVLAPPCVYALHAAFMRYTAARAGGLELGRYTMLPGSAFWYVPASLVGAVAACVLVSILYRVLLRGRAAEYRYVSNASAGFNATGMFIAAGIFFTIGGLALGYFAAHSRLQLTDREIVVHRLWSLDEERYPYARVKALKELESADGKKTDFIIEFDGAPEWTTAVEIIFPGADEKGFLARQTGKPILQLKAQ
ncbi:MAG TPA: hypothetical protein VGT02_11375 [Methylomirabilota bacterium]|jgi:hypothetical protein|nr:hypothetical protein [Methylomirabilota bacterium]